MYGVPDDRVSDPRRGAQAQALAKPSTKSARHEVEMLAGERMNGMHRRVRQAGTRCHPAVVTYAHSRAGQLIKQATTPWKGATITRRTEEREKVEEERGLSKQG